MEFTKENLLQLEQEWFNGKHPYLRYGQLMVNKMSIPKELGDKVYEKNTSIARMYLWEYFGE